MNLKRVADLMFKGYGLAAGLRWRDGYLSFFVSAEMEAILSGGIGSRRCLKNFFDKSMWSP